MKKLFGGLIGLLFLCTGAFAQNSNVNVNITTQTLTADAFTRVILSGAGGGTVNFFDLATAPATASDAIALALASLGLPSTQSLSTPISTLTGTDSLFDRVVTSNYNPTDDPAFVIGDPDDYSTWIAISNENVNVEVAQTTTNYTLYSVKADILSATTPVPLPASGLLLVAALGGSAWFSRRRRR